MQKKGIIDLFNVKECDTLHTVNYETEKYLGIEHSTLLKFA